MTFTDINLNTVCAKQRDPSWSRDINVAEVTCPSDALVNTDKQKQNNKRQKQTNKEPSTTSDKIVGFDFLSGGQDLLDVFPEAWIGRAPNKPAIPNKSSCGNDDDDHDPLPLRDGAATQSSTVHRPSIEQLLGPIVFDDSGESMNLDPFAELKHSSSATLAKQFVQQLDEEREDDEPVTSVICGSSGEDADDGDGAGAGKPSRAKRTHKRTKEKKPVGDHVTVPEPVQPSLVADAGSPPEELLLKLGQCPVDILTEVEVQLKHKTVYFSTVDSGSGSGSSSSSTAPSRLPMPIGSVTFFAESSHSISLQAKCSHHSQCQCHVSFKVQAESAADSCASVFASLRDWLSRARHLDDATHAEHSVHIRQHYGIKTRSVIKRDAKK